VGGMLLPPAIAFGCHPARPDARGGGNATAPAMGQGKGQQSTVCNKNNNNQPAATKTATLVRAATFNRQ